MNFFDHQEQAKKRTQRFLVFFIFCVLAVCGGMMLISYGLMAYAEVESRAAGVPSSAVNVCLTSGLITFVIILVASLVKATSIGGKGGRVMRSLGAVPVPASPTSPDLIRLRNVTEEMALASGIPVPELYIMEEESINACAAGLEPGQAAIAVTRGCLRKLNREELQGVIAHEFSHILHGDMRLNTHMIAWLFGLLVFQIIGRTILEISAHSRVRSSKDKGGGVLMVIGFCMMILGLLGLFFGRLLQSRISQQREYLADASAVQYTRNPTGLVNALRKIGGAGRVGRLKSAHVEELAHMMFSESVRGFNMATHPPLSQRILRLDASWDQSWLSGEIETPEPSPPPPTPSHRTFVHPAASRLEAAVSGLAVLGMVTPLLLEQSKQWMKELPEDLEAAVRNPGEAPRVICELLRRHAGLPGDDQFPSLAHCSEEDAIPLLELALPALRQLPPTEQQELLEKVRGITQADHRLDLVEYTVQQVLENGLPGLVSEKQRPRQLAECWEDISTLLSIMAALDTEKQEDVATAFADAVQTLPGAYRANLVFREADRRDLQAFHESVSRMASLPLHAREHIMRAGLVAVMHDSVYSTLEVKAFRALAALFRLPVPPHLAVSGTMPSA